LLPDMKIIVGLGNPGNHYRLNRHNIGFRCIDHIADRFSIPVKKRLCKSDTGQGNIAGCEVLLARPRTYVNLSGEAINSLLDKFHAKPGDLIVIHDDLDLPTGRIRLRLGGGSGGHRGIKSTIDCVGSKDFNRVRIGISRPGNKGSRYADEDEIVDYVLGDFPRDEEDIIKTAVASVAEAVECILTDGMEIAMNRFNRRGAGL
jgi:PTH1 family peptidyl-tRNA hydrolase